MVGFAFPLSWHESLCSGHCRYFYFLRVSKSEGWWTVIFQIKKSAVLMSPLPHPGTFSFWSQCRIGSWTLSFDSVWQVGEMDWLMNFILFERKKLCHLRRTQKYSRNISVVFWLFLVQWEDAVFVFIFVFARSETIFLSHSCIRWLNYKYHSVLCNRAAVLGKDWLVQSCLQEFRLYYPPLMLGKFKRVVFSTINAQLWNWKLKHKWFLKETAKKKKISS